MSIEHRLIPVDRNAPVDGDVREISDRYAAKERETLGEKLGASPVDYTHELKTRTDSTLGISSQMR